MKKFLLFILICASSALFGQNAHPHYEDGKLYLKVRESVINFRGFDAAQSASALRNLLDKELNMAGVIRFQRMFPKMRNSGLDNIFRIEISNPARADEAVRILSANANVEYAEKVPLKKYFFVPDDTLYSNTNQWNLFKINAALAWNYVSPGTSATVAVIDEGIDITHPDLQANIWHNNLEIPNNGIDDDGNFFVDDFDSWDFGDDDITVTPLDSTWNHGTHVAGIASAVSNNVTGIASIGYNCKVMAVKGSSSNVVMTNGYEAIAYAAENGADVINLSWGGPASSITEEMVVLFANALNVVLVAASGNSGTDQVNYPAGYHSVISVASTGTNDVRVFSSNYGPTIDLCAPGINILSTITGGGYGLKTGTSMAAPLVAGLACLMRSYHPSVSVADLENCLKSSADNIDFMNPNFTGMLGAGRINAFNAMSCVVSSRFGLDVWVESLQEPAVWVCDPVVMPKIRVRNHGTDTLTGFEYHYRFDQGPLQSASWSGSAVYDSILFISLPTQSLGSGSHSLTFYTSWPNQQVDWNLFNDTLHATFNILPAGINAPFHETFNDTSDTRHLWSIDNPDGGIGWKFRNQLIGSQNSGLAWINLFNYSAIGEKDALLSPPLNLYGLDSAWVSFNYASRVNYRSTGFDTLRVFVSQDCGSSFLPAIAVIPLDSNMATSADTTNTFFKANQNAQWCDSLLSMGCYKIDLGSFIGQQNISIRLEITNQAGNNFFLDDFRFEGIETPGAVPQPQFVLSQTQICQGEVVTMSATSVPPASSWQWVVQGAEPDTVIGQMACFLFPAAGTYAVQLTAGNQSGQATTTQTSAVTVSALPSVQIVSDSNIVCLGDSLLLSVNGSASYTWQSDGTLSSLTGSAVHMLGVSPGNFTVTLNAVNAQGCSASSVTDFVVTSCLGIEESKAALRWNAYYDAYSNGIRLNFENATGGTVELFSLAGQRLIANSAPSGKSQVFIPVAGLSKGVYIIRHAGQSMKLLVF